MTSVLRNSGNQSYSRDNYGVKSPDGESDEAYPTRSNSPDGELGELDEVGPTHPLESWTRSIQIAIVRVGWGPFNTPDGGLDEAGSVVSSLENRLLERLNNLFRELVA
ncbi:hypothetical protein F2Q69_00002577 [Brassica cretica]|uniref:Uncharacterized protein n=1 Tax=Brassica cretica TaxID=69181 RepID=A0A8S9NMQ5_BRACR|nr:hypothetical protein F2Q69_00002577 [Brassica cretica]